MAFGNKLLFIFVNGQQVANSKNMEAIFKGLEVSSDGNSNGYQITQGAATFAEITYDSVVFRAVTAGLNGNNIALVFDGEDDVDTVIGVWNTDHPTNTVAYVGTHGADVLDAGTATLSGAVDYTGGFDLNGKKITHMADATASSGAATKGQMDTALSGKISTSEKGAVSGVCPLDSTTKVAATYLPSYVDDVLEYANFAAFPVVGTQAEKDYVSVGGTVRFTAANKGVAGNDIVLVFNGTADVNTVVDAWNEDHTANQVGFSEQVGTFVPDAGTATLIGGVDTVAETGKIYIDIATKKVYRFSGSVYTEISPSPGSTDEVTEGATNKYYTATAARSDLIAASISDSDTTHAPDGNSVFDALAGKAASGHDHSGVYSAVGHGHASGDITNFASDVKAAAVSDSITDGVTTVAPSQNAVFDALALKSDLTVITGAFVRQFTNKHTGAITARQIVYASAAGEVKLAKATDPDTFGFGLGTMFGVVQPASITADAPGNIYIPRSTIISYFSGLVVGSPLYLSRDTAGAYVQDLTGFTTGDHVILLGTVISATEIVWDPKYLYKIAA